MASGNKTTRSAPGIPQSYATRVKFFNAFVESGYIDVVTQVNYNEGVVYFNDMLLARYNKTQEEYLEYMRSFEGKFKYREYEPGMPSLSWSDVEEDTALLGEGNTGTMPGKLKYLHQAQYGRKDDVTAIGVMISEDENNKQISYGLYTAKNNDYYLLRLEEVPGTDSVAVYYGKVKMTGSGKTMHKKYKSKYGESTTKRPNIDQPELDVQLMTEGYVLAYASSVEEWVRLGSVECVGEPICYGWNFNWNGDKAIIVTQKFTSGVGGIEKVTARVYSLVITESGTFVPNGVTASKDEEVDWTPDKGIHSFWHAYTDKDEGIISTKYWVVRGCASAFATPLEYEAPYYGYYNDKDEMVIGYATREEPDYGGAAALTRLHAWRAAQPCRATSGEFFGLNTETRLGMYITINGELHGESHMEFISGSSGYMQDYAIGSTKTTTTLRCIVINCLNYFESTWGNVSAAYDWPVESYCNRSPHRTCGYGISQNMASVDGRNIAGYNRNGSIYGASSAFFAVIPFNTCEGLYFFGTRRYHMQYTKYHIDNVAIDSITPMGWPDGGDCNELQAYGPIDMACTSIYGSSPGTSELNLCQNNGYSDSPITVYEHKILGYLATRGEVLSIEDYTDELPDAQSWSHTYQYTAFFEPGWLLCYPPYTPHHPFLVHCQDSAFSAILHDDAWGVNGHTPAYIDGLHPEDAPETEELMEGLAWKGLFSGIV